MLQANPKAEPPFLQRAVFYKRKSMTEKIELLEKLVVSFFNLDGWNLRHAGNKELYDAKGFTPKGIPCVMEIKNRNSYYQEKMIEVGKYERLMSLDKEILKFYFVIDPKGNYLFLLNDIDVGVEKNFDCPNRSYKTTNMKRKKIYLLNDSKAIIINLNN